LRRSLTSVQAGVTELRFKLIAVFFLLILSIATQAEQVTPLLLSVNLERTQGVFIKEDVFQKAILLKSQKPTEIVLLIFRGWPGIAKIESPKDWWRNLNYMQNQVPLFLDAGISLVVMDCPTDQQALIDRSNPASCDDGYRSSMQHASDVQKMINQLKADHRFIAGASVKCAPRQRCVPKHPIRRSETIFKQQLGNGQRGQLNGGSLWRQTFPFL